MYETDDKIIQIIRHHKNVKKDPKDIVKLTDMNGVYEVYRPTTWPQFEQTTKRISGSEYVDLKTGEILTYKATENRSQNLDSLRLTFKKIRNTINANFYGEPNELMITFTYEENMRDRERLYSDFKRFMTRFRRKYKHLGRIEYINITEPQKRGAWHCHVLFKFPDQEKVYIPNDVVYELWDELGWTKTKAIGLGNIDNIGAYLSAYLGDLPLNEDPRNSMNLPVEEKEVEGKKKKFIKGGRLHLYPTKMNIIRKSRGMITPEPVEMEYQEAKIKIGQYEPTYVSTIEVREASVDADRCLNTHNYEYYNTRRQPRI